MDTNNQNLFGSLKSSSGAFTCGACFQEFTSYNDLILHERMHLEQMSLASLQTHLLPQYNNRAAMIDSNFQALSTDVQNDTHTIDAFNPVVPGANQTIEQVKRPSPAIATGQESGILQLDLSKTSQYSNLVSNLKEQVSPITDTESPDEQVEKTHIELKTPTYIAVPYGGDFQPTKPSQRRGSQDFSNSYNSDDIPSKVACDSPDIEAMRNQQDDRFVVEELYQSYGTAAEKPTVITTKSDFTVSGIIQPDTHTTVYNLANINKSIQLTNNGITTEKPLFEAIPFYYEQLQLDVGNPIKKQVTDYSIQTLSNCKPNTLQSVQPTNLGVVLPLNVPNYFSVSSTPAKQTYTTQAAEYNHVADYSIQTLSGNKCVAGGSVIQQDLPPYTSVQVSSDVSLNTTATVPSFVQTSVADYTVQTVTTSTTPAIVPIAVSDNNEQQLIGNINQLNNIQYHVQLPMSTIKQLPQYQYALGTQQPLAFPVQVIEMPVSANYLKKETETSSASQSSQLINPSVPAYIQTTLSYTPPQSVTNSVFKLDHYVDSQLSQHAYRAVNQCIKKETENFLQSQGNFLQSQYQFTAVPVSNISSSASELSQTLNKSFSDTPTTVKSSVAMSPRALTQPTAALPKQVVTASSSPSKKQQPSAVKLSDGSYYPGGLPFPKKVNKSEAVTAEKVTDDVIAMENDVVMNETSEVKDESTKQKEFVDMIKMVQGQKGFKRKYEQLNDSSDGENNDSEDYKVDIVCFICSEEFQKKKKLYKHLEKHRKCGELSPEEETDDDDGERKQKKICKYCGRQFMRLPHLIEHIRKHTSEKPFDCRFCSQAYANRLRCTRHEATHNNDEVGIHCEICDSEMETKAFYLYHMNEHVLDENRKIEEEKQQEFADMIRNMQSDKSNETEKNENTEDQMLNLLLDFEKDKSNLPYAENVKEVPETVSCRICPEKVVKNEFLNHFKSHKVYICKVCKRGFTKKLTYKYHSDTMHYKEETIDTASVKKTFVCTICEKRLSKHSKLKMHLQTHVSNEPLLRCEVCEEPFHNIGDYFYHLSKHDDKDATELVEREKREKEKFETKSKNGLKIKICNPKVPKFKKVEQIDVENELSDKRELRQRDKKKKDYSWHGLLEENLKNSVRNGEKRKLQTNGSENESRTKRSRKQVVRYSENSDESSAHHKNIKKRKLLSYTTSDDETKADKPQNEEKCINTTNNEVKKPGEVEIRLTEVMKCKVCNKSLTKLDYTEHFKSHFLLSCEECQRSFVKKKAFISHYKNVHETEISEEFVDKEFAKFQENKPLQLNKMEMKGNQTLPGVINKEKTPPHAGIQPQKRNYKELKEIRSTLASKQSTTENRQENQKIGYMYERGTENPFVCTVCHRRFSKQCGVISHFRMHTNADSQRQKLAETGIPHSLKIKADKVSKELFIRAKNLVSMEIEPKTKYFCEICQKTIAQRHNYETHMKAKHKNEVLENKIISKQEKKVVENNPKIKLGIDVRSPPKKRKIFMDDVCDQATTISETNHHFSPENAEEKGTEIVKNNRTSYENQLSEKTSLDSKANKIDKNESDHVENLNTYVKGTKNNSSNPLVEKPHAQLRTCSKDGKVERKEIHVGPKEKSDSLVNVVDQTSKNEFNKKTPTQTTKDSKNDHMNMNELDTTEKLDVVKDNDHETSDSGKKILREIVLSNSAFKKCPICFMKLYSTKLYEKHMKTHSKSVFFSCKSCDLSFESQEQLNNHTKIHLHDNPILNTTTENCSDDSGARKYAENMNQKLGAKPVYKNNVHNDPQDLVCRLCHANFMTKLAFDIHLQHHVDEENDADERSNENDDDEVENMIESLEQYSDVQLGIGNKNGNEYAERGSVGILKQDGKVKYANEIVTDATDNGDFYFTGKQDNGQSMNKLHGTLNHVTENDYLKQYGVQGFKYNTKAHFVNELVNGAIICANNESEIQTKSNDTCVGQSSTKININEGSLYIQNMGIQNRNNQNDRCVDQGVLQQNNNKNLANNIGPANYLVHNTVTPKGTEPVVVNDAPDGSSHNWADCVPTLPFSDNVNWQDKWQSEFMYSNARTLSQPVRPDSIEYGCARNYDT